MIIQYSLLYNLIDDFQLTSKNAIIELSFSSGLAVGDVWIRSYLWKGKMIIVIKFKLQQIFTVKTSNIFSSCMMKVLLVNDIFLSKRKIIILFSWFHLHFIFKSMNKWRVEVVTSWSKFNYNFCCCITDADYNSHFRLKK